MPLLAAQHAAAIPCIKQLSATLPAWLQMPLILSRRIAARAFAVLPMSIPRQIRHRIGRFQIQVAERVTRLPPYLFGRINALLYEKRRAGDDVIDLGMGNPSDPPEDLVIEKLAEAARDPRNHGYSKSNGIVNLRREVAGKYFKQYGVRLDPGRGGDRLPRLEGRLQPHVPGADGAGRHGDRAGAVLSGPRVLRWRWRPAT